MKPQWTLGALSLLVLAPLPLVAQERSFRVFGPSPARLGVMVRIKADAEKDKLGATLGDVLPDSPADRAGLKKGDIITRFNTTALGGLKADDEDESGPGQKLVELARKLEPGDTVRLEYRRDSSTRQATVVAEERPGFAGGTFWMDLPRLRMPELRGFAGPEPDLHLFWGGGPAGLNLVEMNEGLGEYFGTKTGVLVLDTPRDSTLPLKAGDVILAIDGREPKSAGHAGRILGSYDEGESVKFDIMRQKRRQSINWTVPERRAQFRRQPERPLERTRVRPSLWDAGRV